MLGPRLPAMPHPVRAKDSPGGKLAEIGLKCDKPRLNNVAKSTIAPARPGKPAGVCLDDALWFGRAVYLEPPCQPCCSTPPSCC